MEDRVFKVGMLFLATVSTEDINHVERLLGIIKGDIQEDDLPTINTKEDVFEAARVLGLDKHKLPKVIMGILNDYEKINVPAGMVGDIGEHLGEKGVGLIPTPFSPKCSPISPTIPAGTFR